MNAPTTTDHRPSKPRIAGAESPQGAISFQDTSYEYRAHGRPETVEHHLSVANRALDRASRPDDPATVIIGLTGR